jgi:hypothetical protein
MAERPERMAWTRAPIAIMCGIQTAALPAPTVGARAKVERRDELKARSAIRHV